MAPYTGRKIILDACDFNGVKDATLKMRIKYNFVGAFRRVNVFVNATVTLATVNSRSPQGADSLVARETRIRGKG